MKNEPKVGINIDVKSLSHTNLVTVIQELRSSNYPELLKMARNELIERLKRKGFSNKKISKILVANEYGMAKKKSVAKEWAELLGITKKEFLELI